MADFEPANSKNDVTAGDVIQAIVTALRAKFPNDAITTASDPMDILATVQAVTSGFGANIDLEGYDMEDNGPRTLTRPWAQHTLRVVFKYVLSPTVQPDANKYESDSQPSMISVMEDLIFQMLRFRFVCNGETAFGTLFSRLNLIGVKPYRIQGYEAEGKQITFIFRAPVKVPSLDPSDPDAVQVEIVPQAVGN